MTLDVALLLAISSGRHLRLVPSVTYPTYVLIAGAGHDGPELLTPSTTATVPGFLAENLGS